MNAGQCLARYNAGLEKMKTNEVNVMPLLNIHIGRKLRRKRKKLCMSLSEAASQLGISPQQLQKYEQAQTRISAGLIYRISLLYGFNPACVYEGFKIEEENDEAETNITIPMGQKKTLNVLLVEPDPVDELITREALMGANKHVKVFCLHDSTQVLDYLRYKKIEVDFPHPDIILLELNLPKSEDGYFILRELKRDPDFQIIPIIIISHTSKLQEVYQAYKGFASGYVCKSDSESYKKSLKGIVHYWLSSVILPYSS